jgi:hypothetical protein
MHPGRAADPIQAPGGAIGKKSRYFQVHFHIRNAVGHRLELANRKPIILVRFKRPNTNWPDP